MNLSLHVHLTILHIYNINDDAMHALQNNELRIHLDKNRFMKFCAVQYIRSRPAWCSTDESGRYYCFACYTQNCRVV